MKAHELKPLLLLLFVLSVLTILADTASAQSPGQNGSRPVSAEDDPLAELEAWNRVKNSKTATDFQAFLNRFPNGAFARQASQKMNELGDPVWNEVKKSSDPFKYRDYIKRFPDSPFAAEAKARMTQLTAAAIEWEKVKSSNDSIVFLDFINANPSSPYIEEARRIGSAMVWEEIKSATDPEAFWRFALFFSENPHAAEAKVRARDLAWQNITSRRNYRDLSNYVEMFPDAPNIAEAKQMLGAFRLDAETAAILRYNHVKFSLGNFGEGWNEFSFTGPCTLKSTTAYGWNYLAGANPIRYEVILDLIDVSDITTQKFTPTDHPERFGVVLKNASGRKTTYYATTFSKTPMWGSVKDRLKDEERTDPWVGAFGTSNSAEQFAGHLRNIVKACSSGSGNLKAQPATAGSNSAPIEGSTADSDSVAVLHDHGGYFKFAWVYGRLELSGTELKYSETAKEGYKEPKADHNFVLPCTSIKSVKSYTNKYISLRFVNGPDWTFKIDENSERSAAFITKVKTACGLADD